jgi:glycosyltransferase involved in cell wall biosynthesis
MLSSDEQALMQRVAIAVCAGGQPSMLLACLESLVCQITTPSIQPRIIVIDNEAEPQNATLVHEVEKTSLYEIAYWHEPRQGIVIARNAALKLALEFGAEWIAFLDDDEVAEPDWLANLMAPEHLHEPILVGHRFCANALEMAAEVHAQDSAPANGGAGEILSASNIRISAAVVRRGLRFQPTDRANCNSDTQFFIEAEKAGFIPQWTDRAIVIRQSGAAASAGL